MLLRVVGAALAAGLLSSCAMLSANAPLFTVADQDGAFALAQGLWVAQEADCKVDPRHSRPEQKSCLDWARIARAPDGAWIVSSTGGEDDAPLRVVIAAAAPRGSHVLSPLYVAESVNQKDGEIGYGALVPRGDLSAGVKRLAVAGVSCDVITDEAPIDGIVVTREDGKVVRCIASTQAAVREATRRAVIDSLVTFGDSELVFVRP